MRWLAIAHGAVRGAYHFVKDVLAIRKERVDCAFLKVAPDNTKEFCVLVRHHLDKERFGNTPACLLKGGGHNTLVVDHTIGPPFVADPHRICIATARHVGALFVVGDINSARDTNYKANEAVRSDAGQHLLLNQTAYHWFMQYFKDNRRVVEYLPPGAQPDPPPTEASAGRGGQGGGGRGRGAGGRGAGGRGGGGRGGGAGAGRGG